MKTGEIQKACTRIKKDMKTRHSYEEVIMAKEKKRGFESQSGKSLKIFTIGDGKSMIHSRI